MKVMLKRTLLLSLLVLVVASLTVFGISAEALTGTYADDAAAVEAGAVAKVTVNGETTYYTTLQEAFDAATADAVVTLIADVTALADPVKRDSTYCSLYVAKDTSVALDLNGHKIAVPDPIAIKNAEYALIYVRGTLVISDSSTEQSGAINVTGVTTVHSSNSSVIKVRGGALTVNSGTVEHQGYNGSALGTFAILTDTDTFGDVTLTINGGNIIASQGSAIRLTAASPNNADASATTNFVMKGGTVSGDETGIWLLPNNNTATDATLTIEGGNITANVDAFYSNFCTKTTSVSTTISGGTFTGTVQARDGEITIEDGIFNGEVIIKDGNKVLVETSDAITGGTFNAGVNPDYLASTADTLLVVCVTGADGSASVYTFETMEAALAALESVDASATVNVSFCKDLDVTDSIVLDRDMIVDGNGYTVSSATAAATITVNANVTFANITVTNSAENGAAIALGATASLHADPTTVLTAAAPFSGYTVGQAITTTDEDLANALNAAGYALTASTADDVTTYTVVTNAPKAALNGWHYDTFANAFADAVAGDVITLLDNLTVDASIVISADITIDANGHTITSNANGAVFTLNASLTLVDATIINNVNDAVAFLLNADVDLTVTGNSALTTATILGGYDLVAHTHKVTVGSAALSAALENEGYFMVDNGDGTYTVSEHAAAKIGNTLFHSLQDALDAAQNGDTIIILKNIELDATVEVTMDLTFSGNFTLISSSATPVFNLANGVALTINCDVECTAENGKLLNAVTDQVVKTNNTDVRDLLNAEGYAMVEETTGVWTVKAAKAAIGTLNYASLEAALAAVQEGETIELLADAELTASAIIDKDITINGNFTITSSAPITFVVNKKLTVNCATVNTYDTGVAFSLGNSATVAINGAVTASKVISGYDVALHTVTTTAESVATKLNGEGYALVKADNTWTVMTDKPEAAVDGWNYVTVEDAIAAGGVVTLLRDVTVEATIEVAGALTFNGNYTLTSTAATAFKLANGATLALNCKLEAADVLDATGAWTVTTSVKAIAEQLNAEGYSLVLSDGVYTITSNSPQVSVDGWNYDTMKNAILDLKNGKFTGSVLRLLKNFSHSAADIDIYTDLTIYGDGYTMTSTASTAIRVYGCTVTFENFKLVSYGDAIVLREHANDSHVVINNSTIDADKVGVYVYAVKGGSAIIKGNTVINAGKAKNNGYALQSYCSDTPITVQDNVALNSALTLAIYFNGTSADIGSAKLIIKDNVTLSSNTVHQMAISENSVNSTWDFSNWNTYKAYAYVKNSNKYQIFGFYTTLKIALEADAISHSETVTNTIYLLDNTTDFGGATVSKPVIIDGNGYSVTVAAGKTAFTLTADSTAVALNNIAINGEILAGYNGQTVTTNMEAIAISLNAQGYALHKEGDIWTVAGLGVVSLNGWNYATIQEALSLIKDGESLNVLIDFTTDATAVIDKDITVYGNGKKITSTAGVAIQISNIVTINDLTLYASGVGIKTADGPVDPIVINLNDCTIGDSAKPIGGHGIQFQYLIVDVTLNMTNSTVYAVGRGVHSDMSNARTVNINIKMDTLDTTNPTICSTGNNGLSFHYANDVNVTLENVYIKAKDTAFGASQHSQNNAANPKIVVASATNCKFESTNGTAIGMNMDKGNVNNRFIADITLTNCTISGVTHGVILDGSTTEHGASKLTISGGSVSCTATGIHLRGDVTASISNVSVTSTGGWAIYTEQTGDTANTVPYINLTVTNCTLSGLGGIRFSAAADATRGNSKLTVSGGTITATGAYNAKVGETTGTDDKPSYVGIFASGAADVAVSNATISAPSTTGIHFWQGCISANLTLTNTHVGKADDLIGRLGIYVYQSNAAEVNITLINSTVAATNIAIKVNGKAAQTANITVTNDALDSVNPTLYSSGTYAISANWACDLHVALTNAYLKSKDSGIHLTQHNTNLTEKNPKILSGTITGCLIESLNSNAINVYTADTTNATQMPMYGLQLTVTDSTLKASNTAVLLSAYEGLEGNYLNLNGNTRLEGNYGLFLRGVGGYITVTATKSQAGSPVIEGTTSAVYIDSTLGVTFTADGGSITSTDGAAIYRKETDGNVTTVIALTDVELSSETNWAIDIYQQNFTDNDHKVDVTLTRCTVTGAYGVRVAGYEAGTAANTSGYALQITGGSISTPNDVLAIEGIYALVKDATLTFAGTGSSNRGVYMQSNTSNAPKLVLDNTTLNYNRTDGQAIYLANNGSNTVILQNKAKIVSKANGINTGDTMYNNTIEVIDSSIEAAGLYGIKFNAKNYQTGILTLVLNGGTIKTTASVADDVAAAQNILPHAIFIREGIVEITSPANSAKNYILAEGNRGVAIFVDRYTGNLDMTLYNTEIKSDSHVFSFGASTAIMGSDIPYLDTDSKVGTANVTLYNSTVTSAEASAVFALLSQEATLNFTVSGTDVTAAADAFYISGKGSFTLGATGGEITSTGAAGVYVNLTEATCTATVTLNGTDVTAETSAIYKISKSKLTITTTNGADLESKNDCLFIDGSGDCALTMTDSSVKATGAGLSGTAHSRGIYVEESVIATIVLTDTTVRANQAAIELCVWGTRSGSLTIKMTDKNVDARTGENADIYSETYRALNFRSGSNYTLDLDNVSVCAGTQAVYRTRPDGGGTVWLNADFTNCNLTSTNNSWVVWVGDGYNPSEADVTWAFNLTFDDCKLVGGGGIIATARTSVKSSLTMTDCTVDANTTLGISLCGYLDAELTRVDVKAYKNKAANDTGAFRVHYDSSVANITMTDVRIWNYGVGTSPKALLVSNGENHLTAHNLELYAEVTGGQGLYWHGIPEPTGKNDNSVEITGKLVIRSVAQAIIFNPKSGGTLKIHLDSGDGRTKTTPDIKSTNDKGIHLLNHTTQSCDVLFTLDLKNVYLEAKDNGVHRSNDSCTVTGTIDQCKFISETNTALYFTNNNSSAKVHFDDFVISNTIADGVNGFLTSGIAGMTSKFTWNNVNIHGSNYGALTSGVVEFVINDSVISAGKKGVQAARGTAAFRASSAGNWIKMTATNTTFEQLGYGTMEVWDNPDTNDAGDPASCCEAGAMAIYVSNGDQYLTFNNCRIYAKEDFGIGLQRGGGARDLDREITLNNSTVEVGFICIGFAENAYAADGKININDSTLTSEKGLVIRCNGTNANTKLTINITDSILTTNGTTLKNTDITDKDESKYLIRAIMLVDGSFTINMHGNSEINAPNTNAISMGAGAGALKFNMTGGTITGNEVIEISSGAGGIDFDMTGGRMIAAGTVAIRLRPGTGKNTVDIKMDALNTTTPDIEARAAWASAFYIHNGANLSMTFENVHVSGTESALNKTDPNNDGTYNVVNFYTLAITATNSKFAVVGHEGDNSGYTVFRIADTAAKQSPIISQITLIDCEIINSANRTDGSMHGFRIDAAEGSFLKMYGGSVNVAHTAFRFRESMDLTVDVSPNTGKGAVIYGGQYVVDPCDNDNLPGAPVYEHVQSATFVGATIETENRVIHLTDDLNGAVMEFNLVMTDSEITAGGIAFFFNITGRVNATITNCDVTAKQGFSTNAATLSVITLRDTNMRCTHRTYEMHGVEGSVLNIIGGIHTNTHDESVLELYEHFDANIYGGYFRSEDTIVLRGRDFATLNVYGGYFELAPAEGVALSKWKGVVRIGTDAGGAGTITNIYGGTFVAPDDVPCYIFCLNKGRNINLYAFNAKGGADIYANQNAANVAFSYPTAEKLYSVNMPVMNDGAQVRLTMGENNEGGIRFVTNLSASIFDYVKYMTDDVNSITFGTLIAPLDYVREVPAFTADLLENAGLDYLDIEAKNGLIYNLDGSVTIRAAINQIKEKNYDRAFAAIAYVKYTVNGEEACLYSAFDAEQNARSLKQLATSALADTMNIQTSTYRFAVGDGTYSRYTDEQRAAMTVYVLCNYREEIVHEPTATTPGLIKGWCDHCGTHFEELLPPVA